MTPEQLVDFHEITRVKHRYLRALDTHQWDLMRTCFADDARSWYSSGRFSAQGADAIIRMLSANMSEGLVSSHVATHPEIEFTGPTTATGVWRFEDTVHALGGDTVLNGAGYYYDEYEKGPDGWRIKSTGYERIFELRETKPAGALQVQVHPRLGARDA
jgi:hypothetical protein